MSPHLQWQKSSSTVGRNSFRENRLGYLDVAIMKKVLSVKLAKNGRENIWSVKVGVHLMESMYKNKF